MIATGPPGKRIRPAPKPGGPHGDYDLDRDQAYDKRRVIEAVPEWVECKHLNRCHGANILRAEWIELGLWSPPLWRALQLPKFGGRYPCGAGCPIVRSREAAA